jgi:hypothetical protein
MTKMRTQKAKFVQQFFVQKKTTSQPMMIWINDNDQASSPLSLTTTMLPLQYSALSKNATAINVIDMTSHRGEEF